MRRSKGMVLALALAACGRTEALAPSANGSAGAGPAESRRVASPAAAPEEAAPAPEGGSALADASAEGALAEAAPQSTSGSDASGTIASPPADMLLVPGGSFTMGANVGGQEDEHPAHTVTLRAFWLDKTEVTNADWDACVAAHACRPKSDAVRTQHADFNGQNQPVSGISWEDARGYCAWRGKRLPREAEFERAARDDDDRRFAWGNDPPTHERTVFGSGRTEDVGTHPAGRGPYGNDDLAGNVWEWMEDEYDPYAYRRAGANEGRPGTCPEILAALDELRRNHRQGFTGSNPIPEECEHSIRGGAYNYDADGLRVTNRVHHPGWYRIPMLGLRCAKDPAGVDAGDGGGP